MQSFDKKTKNKLKINKRNEIIEKLSKYRSRVLIISYVIT